MADYNVNMKQWNGSSFDNVLPLAYNAKQLGGQSLAEVKQWVQDNGLLLYTGQYTGTGTYGMNNPSSITFPFVPILFFFPVGFKTINTNDLTQDYKSFTIDASRYGSTNVYLKKKVMTAKQYIGILTLPQWQMSELLYTVLSQLVDMIWVARLSF